jgi:hypothetical protein
MTLSSSASGPTVHDNPDRSTVTLTIGPDSDDHDPAVLVTVCVDASQVEARAGDMVEIIRPNPAALVAISFFTTAPLRLRGRTIEQGTGGQIHGKVHYISNRSH